VHLRPPLLPRLSPRPAAHAPSCLWPAPVIRFEDASDKAGIKLCPHALDRGKLGSLLEGNGRGLHLVSDYKQLRARVSFNVVNGRPLDDSMHPLSAEREAGNAAHITSIERRQRFTLLDVTGAIRTSIRICTEWQVDGRRTMTTTALSDLLVDRLRKDDSSYRNDRNGHFYRCDPRRPAIQGWTGWAISSTWLDYQQGWMCRSFCGPAM